MSSPASPVSSPAPDDRAAFQFVYGQLALGKKDPDIVSALVAKGVQSDRAPTIVQTARTQRRNAIRGRGKRRMKRGAILVLIGIAITIGTFLAAGATGGFYVVSFGPVLLGLYYLAFGISDSMTR